ncbi:MAG: hypothetical protein LBB88_09120 [Planctomycetaceae bacterium]|jgi:hypothetical protein|nr:hypothetical protein [Planctomycetaceae bacterium]
MKRNLQGMSYRQIISLIGIFALCFGLFYSQSQQTQAATLQTNKSQIARCKDHNRVNCSSCYTQGIKPETYYELVPHVVLPETIQYNLASPKDGNKSVGGGTTSPFVATYTAFPSYNLPVNTEMRQINQAIYPVTPKILPMPLPTKNSNKDDNKDDNKDNNKNDNQKNNSIKRNEKQSVETQFELDKNKQQSNPDNSEQNINSSEKSTNLILSKTNSNKKHQTTSDKIYDSSITDEMFNRSMAILQASAMEEIIPATPRFALDDNVTQTGIFCNSTPKPPVAWSFSSPIFKAAAVPTGFGNGNGYISQFNNHGGVNVGFQPSPVGIGQPQPQPQAGSYPFPYPSQLPPNYSVNNEPNVQVLPNGMLLLSTPPNHHNCGLLRCRFDHSRRYILLPPNPNQFPGIIPQTAPQSQLPIPPATSPMPTINPQTQALIYPNPNPYLQQPQLLPVTAMTPYGMTIIGYRQATPQMPDYGTFGNGAGIGGGNFNGNFMNVAYGNMGQQFSPAQFQFIQQQQQLAQQQFIQYQLAQQKLIQQQLAQQKLIVAQNNANSQTQDSVDTENKNNADESSELQTPLPINGIANNAASNGTNAIQDPTQTSGVYANPYAMYALQSGNLATGVNNANVGDAGVGISGEQSVGLSMNQLNPQVSVLPNPYYANYPISAAVQPYGSNGLPYGFNPYAAPIYPAAQFGNQQFMPPYGQPYFPANYLPVGLQPNIPQQQANQGGNGLTMSDILMLMVLMKENNKPQRRLTFFERIAERRAARRQRTEQNDPFNQMMQLWSTPFYPDSTARMPASNAYPYGYFGAQPSTINTANYGGYHNLYYGNTTYY